MALLAVSTHIDTIVGWIFEYMLLPESFIFLRPEWLPASSMLAEPDSKRPKSNHNRDIPEKAADEASGYNDTKDVPVGWARTLWP